MLKLEIEKKYIVHLFNLFFINLFEEQVRDGFNECFTHFIVKLGANFIFKYLICELEHPSKKVKHRYLELLNNLHMNGSLTDCIDETEVIPLQNISLKLSFKYI